MTIPELNLSRVVLSKSGDFNLQSINMFYIIIFRSLFLEVLSEVSSVQTLASYGLLGFLTCFRTKIKLVIVLNCKDRDQLFGRFYSNVHKLHP